jgi:hypothetical protein
MPFPITLRFTPFSLSFLCFSLSVFSSFKFFVRLFLFCSFVALLSPSKISAFRAISLDHRLYSSSTRARSEVSFRSFSLLTRQTHSSRSNTGGFDRFFTT